MMCARKESMKFDMVWEDCIQEETRVANREALLNKDNKSLPLTPKEEEANLISREEFKG